MVSKPLSGWMYGFGDDALADRFPILFSHCKQKDVSVKDVLDIGLIQNLVPRLASAASAQLQNLQSLISTVDTTAQNDKRLSHFIDSNGKLDTGTIYKLLKARDEAYDDKAAFIWRSAAPPRVQLLMWLLCQKRIQCRTKLQKKGIVSQPLCEVCNEDDETADHIISGCPIARQYWAALGIDMPSTHDVRDLHKLKRPQNIPNMALIHW